MQNQIENPKQSEKEESLEKILEEIIGSVRPVSTPIPPTVDDKVPFFLFNKEKAKVKGFFRLFPLTLCIAFLGGVFLGTVFGYFWGASQKEDQEITALESIVTKLDQLIQEKEVMRFPKRESYEII